MAFVRTKTIKGKTYRYLVKSVRDGKKVRQVFVSYIGNPPSAPGRVAQKQDGSCAELTHLADFRPLVVTDIRVPYVWLMKELGCQSVVFTLRSPYRHGDVQAARHPETGVYHISQVRLNRNASAEILAHEAGHVLDYVLQSEAAESGSLDAQFAAHRDVLRKLADYTCAHHATSSPDALRRFKHYPASKERDRVVKRLERYYHGYVYQDSELFARLVSVSFTEPDIAKAIAPAAYEWLKVILYGHDRIRVALTEVGLWSIEASR